MTSYFPPLSFPLLFPSSQLTTASEWLSVFDSVPTFTPLAEETFPLPSGCGL